MFVIRVSGASPMMYLSSDNEGFVEDPVYARKFSLPADAECALDSMELEYRRVMKVEVVPFAHEDAALAPQKTN